METKVNKLVAPPDKYITVMGGITTEESAKRWGEKMGFSLVYWVRRRQRVYGIKRIDENGNKKL